MLTILNRRQNNCFKYLILLPFLFFLLNQCIFSPDDPKKTEADGVVRLQIPEREHGYSNFPTTLITSSDSLANFISKISAQSAWNNKKVFIDSLTQSNIDFNTEVLLLFRHTETSGSNTVTVRKSYSEDSDVIVEIERDLPSVGTTDMAYYCFAYRIEKKYGNIVFKIEGQNNITIPLY